MKRNFIIGSMYGLSAMDVEHFETDRRQLPVVDSADEAASIARLLAYGTNGVWLVDISGICKQSLRFITDIRTSSIQSGVVLDQLFKLLSTETAATVAIQLTHLLREDQLARVGRGGVLAMRDAAAALPEAESEMAVAKLDSELLRRGPIHSVEVGATLVLGDETRRSAVELAAERVRGSEAPPRAKVVVVYRYRPGIDHDLAIAHVKVQIRRSIDRRLWKKLEDVGRSNIFTLDERLLRPEFSRGVVHSFQAIAKSWSPRSWVNRTFSRGEAT